MVSGDLGAGLAAVRRGERGAQARALVLATLPAAILSPGLFLIALNAAMRGLAARLLPGFAIDGFLPAAPGRLVVTVVGWIASRIL